MSPIVERKLRLVQHLGNDPASQSRDANSNTTDPLDLVVSILESLMWTYTNKATQCSYHYETKQQNCQIYTFNGP